MLKPEQLAAHFSQQLGKRITITPTQNRRTYLSWHPVPGGLEVRLHEVFLAGDASILTALRWLLQEKNQREARQRLCAFFASRVPAATQAPESREGDTESAKGSTYDLSAMMSTLNETYFDNGCRAGIRWSHRSGIPSGAAVRLGYYDFQSRMITLSAFLDHPEVPEYVVAHTVYHEMLHEALGVDHQNGRRRVHTPEFRALERRFTRHDEAMTWLRDSFRPFLERLRRRRGRAM